MTDEKAPMATPLAAAKMREVVGDLREAREKKRKNKEEEECGQDSEGHWAAYLPSHDVSDVWQQPAAAALIRVPSNTFEHVATQQGRTQQGRSSCHSSSNGYSPVWLEHRPQSSLHANNKDSAVLSSCLAAGVTVGNSKLPCTSIA
jgi:hypothetical protein